MANKNRPLEEVEKLLKDIGEKIDELIEKGKKVSGEAGDEIDKKINDLKNNQWDLERDLQEMKARFGQRFDEEKKNMEPKLKKSGQHLKAALFQLNEAIKSLFEK